MTVTWYENGITKPLTSLEDDAHLKFSDDGELIAFARDGLWMIHSDGSGERSLVSHDDFKSMEPKDPGVALAQFEWIPGTHRLLFNTILLADYGLAFTNDLYRVDAETQVWTLLRHSGEAGKFIFSPDGKRVVLVTPGQISLMNVDGSGYHIVLHYHVPFPSEMAYYATPIWAPDSRSLTVAIPPEDFFYGTKLPTVLWRIPIDGTPPVAISQLPAGESGEDGRIWSPDKEHFAIRSDDSTYHLGTEGTDLGPLTEPNSIVGWFTWVDETHFLYLGICDLRLGTVGAPSILITDLSAPADDCISNYDFVK